jgi:hypothetical protein
VIAQRTIRMAWAAGVLAGILALLAAGAADAPALGVSLTKTTALVPVSVPSLPTVSTPAVGVSIPSVSVSVAGAEASTPSVSVSGPTATVSGEGVSVSGPEVGVSTPNPPVTGSPPPPANPDPPGEPGSGDPPAPRGSPSGGGAGASTAQVAATSPALADSAPQDAAPTRPRSSADTQPLPSARVPSGKHRRRDRSVGPAGAAVGPARGVRRSGLPGVPNASATHARAHAHSPASLLDRIGGHIPLPLPVPNWSKPIILVLLLLAIGFAVRSFLSGVRVRRLERQRVTMQRDLDVMQAALVPRLPAELEGLAISVAYRPAEGPAAGGDFYDAFVLSPGRVAIILGDVAGHGHQALTQAALTRYTLRAYLQAGLEPRATLALAGSVLADPTCEHFATVAVAVYDTREGRLTYSCAGHPPPIVHGLEGYEPLTVCASTPIGWRIPTGRRQTTISLPAGALACFFSDGLIEARRGKELLGRERVSELLAALGTRPAAKDLLAQVQQAALTTPDDMAACILLPSDPAGYAHIEELEVDADRLDAPSTRRFLEACGAPPREIAQALARATEIAGAREGALLRVDMGAASTTVTARMPRSPEHSRARVDAPAVRVPAAT